MQLPDQRQERVAIVIQRGGCRLARATQQLAEGGLATAVSPEHVHLDEIADHPRELRSCSTRSWRANQQIVLAAPAMEQHDVGAEQHHVQRRALLASDLAQRVEERGREVEALDRTLEGLDSGTRSIKG